MLRHVLVRSPLLGGVLPFDIGSRDAVSKDTETARKYYEEREQVDGWTRLGYMYSLDEFGNFSPELNSVLQVGTMGLFIGAVYGGIQSSKVAYLDFIQNNQATQFKNHLDAKKKLQDRVTVSFGRGAFKWGWRLGLFSGMYILVTTSMSVYRGRSGLVEYVAGGTLAGAAYKLGAGPRPAAVGGLLGAALGCVAGGLSLALLRLTGTTMEEVRYWQYQFHEERQRRFQHAVRQHRARDDSELLRAHDTTAAAAARPADLTGLDAPRR